MLTAYESNLLKSQVGEAEGVVAGFREPSEQG